MPSVRFASLGFNPSRFRQLLQERDLQGILLCAPENVFYATGYPCLPSSGNPILYTLRDVLPFFAYVDQSGYRTLGCWGGAAAGVDYGADEVLTFADFAGSVRSLSQHLRTRAGAETRIGVESTIPHSVYRLIADCYDPARIVVADDVMTGARLIKTADEIAGLEASTRIVEAAVADLMAQVEIGMSRAALMRSARVALMQHGASGISHITISFGSSNPEVEIDEALEPNKLVTLDLGAMVNGYASDNRRLMYSGDVPERMRALHRTMCSIVAEVGTALRPGARFGDIYNLALDLHERNHLTPYIPNVGHTIGLQTEEVWIYGDSDLTLQPGMVLNLEMYSRFDNGELIGDEETYVIETDGPRQLTTLPTEIRSVY